MKIEDVAKQIKNSKYTGPCLGNAINPSVYINKALNGFFVTVNGETVICENIGKLQAFLEEYYE